MKKLSRWIRKQSKKITPGTQAVKGAATLLLGCTAFIWILFSGSLVINLSDPYVLVLSIFFAGCAVLAGFLSRAGLKLLASIPRIYALALLITVPLLVITGAHWSFAPTVVVLTSLLGAATLSLVKRGTGRLTLIKKIIAISGGLIAIAGIGVLSFWFFERGFETKPFENAANTVPTPLPVLTGVSPAAPGSYKVSTLTYGSGKDRHRPAYGTEAVIITDSVDGCAFIDDWDGIGGWWRERYWGFDASSLPLNGRVWYPEGNGPFPLVLVVHGNHGMQDYSDPGYDYLGNLLASRGIILASIDQNFINSSWSDLFDGLSEENDARGWLLLEHLRTWHEWNSDQSTPFYQKVDTDKLALIGHSRGGEAVAHAAFFNQLPYYPDDASIKFDYGYSLQSIIAIAPVDGQYEPGNDRTEIKNINYFVIHGSQDADVRSYMGSQQYERVTFDDSLYHFKSGLYVYGANHGQFNTSWGENDRGFQWQGFLNLKQLLPADEQQQIAKVYISAFLEATLLKKTAYLPLFLDARTGSSWLSETTYLNQFEDASFEPLMTFEEDFDVSTTTWKDGQSSAKNLTVWREAQIKLKWQEKGTKGLYLGWHYPEEDSTSIIPDSLLASYTIRLPDFGLDSSKALVLSLAESTESSNPKTKGKWVKNNQANNKADKDKNNGTIIDDGKEQHIENEKDEKDSAIKPSLDFTIQLEDVDGQVISFPLSRFSPVQRQIKVAIMKTDFITDDTESEKVYQTFYFPVQELDTLASGFNWDEIKEIKLVFDRSKKGVLSIDRIGFMDLLP